MTTSISSPVVASARSTEASRRPAFVRQTAERTFSGAQRMIAAVAVAAFVACLAVNLLLALRVLVAAVLVFSAAHLALRCLLVASATRRKFPPRSAVATEDLPRYTTLHPMYDEANMIPVVVAAMEALDYPKDRLQCLLVLEERDRATVEAARSYPLPPYFQIVETPTAKPYGKPKACNHALQFATGEFVVIFDAEDRPEPQQLRRAVETFRAAEERQEPLGCVQARLVFDNQSPAKGTLGEVIRDWDGYDVRPTTWCSRLLGNEYNVHFTLVLPGLAHLGLPVPLGGTSNHFPLAVLRDVAFAPELMPDLPGDDRTTGAWDPWNVTEDAELGGAIAAHGYSTCVFDSHTDEEAVLTPIAAVNQRSRWVKGYAQTSLVLLRRPINAMRAMGPISFVAYLLQVGGTYLSLLLMPLTWGLTATFVVTRSPFIIDLFPGPLLYLGILLTVGSNIALVSISLVAALRERQFAAVRHVLFLTPLWWFLLSAATWIATLELIFPRWRPAWNKTAHGVRYATRRRVWWLAFQRQARVWDSRPAHRRRIAPLRPALDPSIRAEATMPTHDQLFLRRSAEERAESVRRAVQARRVPKPPGPARQAFDERRAAAQKQRQAALRAASELPPRPSGFGSGAPGQNAWDPNR